MLHWCGNGSGGSAPAPLAVSVFLPFSDEQTAVGEGDDGNAACSSVDCTLTLGTPYTRNLPSSVSSPSWQSKSSLPANVGGGFTSSGGGGGGGSVIAGSMNGDPLLLSRRCANCDTTSTPLWRNGPRGPKSLCNACGIRYKKEERRAAAAAAAPPAGEEFGYGYTPAPAPAPHTWGCYAPVDSRVKSSVFAGKVDEQRELYFPWRLNDVSLQFPAAGDGGLLSQYQ